MTDPHPLISSELIDTETSRRAPHSRTEVMDLTALPHSSVSSALSPKLRGSVLGKSPAGVDATAV
jgi:hypothetical protein